MQATHATRPSYLHRARPLILVGLALTLALAAFVARAALSMAIDPISGAAGSPPGPGTAFVAGATSNATPTATPDATPDATPTATADATPTATADPTATPIATPAQSDKVIKVSIADQRLTAYENGVALFSTVVATGRPELPTPRGTFHIKAKYSPYTFISPWPKGDPYWYPTLTVSWAMLFADGGYFLHDSPHRTLYGPGANLTNGTHGCVNVPLSSMARLYSWATVGTTVVVE